MRVAFVARVAGLVLLATAASRICWGMDVQRDFSAARAASISASVFRSAAGETGAQPLHLRESLKLSGTRLDTPVVPYSGFFAGVSGGVSNTSWSGKKTAIAIISSAILPGLGELYCYMGSRDNTVLARSVAFIALDGYLWYGYFDNHKTGKDFKRDYMDYADAHWSLDRFLAQHPCCNQGVGDACDSWTYFNQTCIGQTNYFFYTPREIDEEEYYENIGKYNAFVFGWDDAAQWDYNDPDEFKNYEYRPPHREYYWSLRKESDTYLLRADQHLMGLLVSRVASMIDAGWIAYRMSKGKDPDKGWSLRFETHEVAPSLMISRRF